MYGIWAIFGVNVGKHSIHGASGMGKSQVSGSFSHQSLEHEHGQDRRRGGLYLRLRSMDPTTSGGQRALDGILAPPESNFGKKTVVFCHEKIREMCKTVMQNHQISIFCGSGNRESIGGTIEKDMLRTWWKKMDAKSLRNSGTTSGSKFIQVSWSTWPPRPVGIHIGLNQGAPPGVPVRCNDFQTNPFLENRSL